MCPELHVLVAALPSMLYLLNKVLKHDNKEFSVYVVYIKCFTLYRLEGCYTTIRGEKYSKYCTNIPFPTKPRKIDGDNVIKFCYQKYLLSLAKLYRIQ